MASSHQMAAVVAVVAGSFLAVALFVPMAAVRYRRFGRLGPMDVLVLLAVTIYGLALWTYTLLPLPDPGDLACRPALVAPFRFVDEVRAHGANSAVDLLRNPTLLQVLLNVALFVPFGVLLRWRRGMGVATVTGLGLALSLFIETTQLTGIWGLYDCAYRYFETDDLIANTTGALLGAVAAAVVGLVLPDRPDPAPVGLTVGRRIVAMVSDVLVVLLVGAAVVVAWRTWHIEVRPSAPADVDLAFQARLQWGVPLALQAVLVLGWGRTIGELVVQVRTVSPGRASALPRRVVKLVTGVGAFSALAASDSGPTDLAFLAVVVASVGAAVVTRDHRGLSNTLAGLRVELAGSARSAPATPADRSPVG